MGPRLRFRGCHYLGNAHHAVHFDCGLHRFWDLSINQTSIQICTRVRNRLGSIHPFMHRFIDCS
jgi:hypothetical protein